MEATTWSSIVSELSHPEVNTCARAAQRLHAEASTGDIPNLLELLQSDDFFVREAAAWPLTELAGPKVLVELFLAYQRGFDEGHDNDGFTAALLGSVDIRIDNAVPTRCSGWRRDATAASR